MAYSLTWLPEVLTAAGLKVAKHPGWEDRGLGDIGQVRGVICHHTVGAGPERGVMPSLGTLVNGRAASANTTALRGPLAQLGLGRDGTYFVIAAGLAQHAGRGAWKDVTTGNSSFIGIEAENTGRGEVWPEVQMDAYRRGAAAILRRIGAGSEWCIGHKEWAPARKPDPNFDMVAFRASVQAILDGTGATRPLIPATDTGGRPTLRRGATGALVKQVQKKIGVAPDGDFGARTEAAVRNFQRGHDLVPDGIVGPRSWETLDTV